MQNRDGQRLIQAISEILKKIPYERLLLIYRMAVVWKEKA